MKPTDCQVREHSVAGSRVTIQKIKGELNGWALKVS